MKNDFKKPLFVAAAPEPSVGLAQKIMNRIERYEQRLFFVRMVGFGACTAGSVALAGFGFVNASTELSQSGFFWFASLLFSDFSSALTNFPDFFLSVMESIPAIPVALLFGGIVFFLWSTSQLSVNINTRSYQFSISR